MTREVMKRRMRASRQFRPEDEWMLDIAIDESVQELWDTNDWSFKLGVDTFSSVANTSTYTLDPDVDTVMEIVYGSSNRVVLPLPSQHLAEMYHNVTRTDTEVQFYTLHSADQVAMTLELFPTPDSVNTYTFKFRRKIAYGDLDKIPDKLHGIVMLGAKNYVLTGQVGGSPDYQRLLAQAIVRDKPISHQRWTLGLDGLQVARVNRTNTMVSGYGSQDVTHPYD